jgi:hypothetical protein
MENNFCFIVPYRRRADHLRQFVSHYSKLFPGIPIYVIEQTEKPDETTVDKLQGFNRGKLMNIGYIEMGKEFSYFCQSDVDMLLVPDKGEGIGGYRYPQNPVHLASHCSQFGGRLPYKTFMGGITLFTPQQYETFGGFSNNFFGHSHEDDQLYEDVSRHFTIERRECWYKCLDHGRPITAHLYHAGREYRKQGRSPDDTIAKCQYEVIDMVREKSYIRIIVDL